MSIADRAAVAELATMASPEAHIRAALARVPVDDRLALLQKMMGVVITERQRLTHEKEV